MQELLKRVIASIDNLTLKKIVYIIVKENIRK
jgi:hypothetical protein